MTLEIMGNLLKVSMASYGVIVLAIIELFATLLIAS